jgi:tryptophan-rich sensory protein
MPLPRQIPSLLASLALAYAAAAIGAAASVNAATFYAAIDRPAWAPPAWLFGPVWTALYGLMAIAAWGVWNARGNENARPALKLYLVQLALNALWSWLFFAWNLGAGAFVGVVVLWGLILATLIMFWRVRPWAGALLLPYLAWVTFAAALNWSVWRANPWLLGG